MVSLTYHPKTKLSYYYDLPNDLAFVQNYDIDWGIYASRWGRIQGFMRELLFKARLPDGLLGSFSAVVQYMTKLHMNYYVHSQIIIYYFFCEVIPYIE